MIREIVSTEHAPTHGVLKSRYKHRMKLTEVSHDGRASLRDCRMPHAEGVSEFMKKRSGIGGEAPLYCVRIGSQGPQLKRVS